MPGKSLAQAAEREAYEEAGVEGTIDAEPILEIGRSYLSAFLARLQGEGHLPPYDVHPVADCLARLAQSEVLTPSKDPLTTDEARAFVRDHLAPFIRLSPEGAL